MCDLQEKHERMKDFCGCKKCGVVSMKYSSLSPTIQLAVTFLNDLSLAFVVKCNFKGPLTLVVVVGVGCCVIILF